MNVILFSIRVKQCRTEKKREVFIFKVLAINVFIQRKYTDKTSNQRLFV
jgi:hypothetical protein